jgi:hypothetical protein
MFDFAHRTTSRLILNPATGKRPPNPSRQSILLGERGACGVPLSVAQPSFTSLVAASRLNAHDHGLGRG